MISEQRIVELTEISKAARAEIVESVAEAASGHPGGSLSVIDILTVLYYEKMDIDPKDPKKADRDRFVLSKGHVAPALYTTLANLGYFDRGELMKLRKTGAMLQGHPDMLTTPGLDASTGSLGQGLSLANGMALAAKLDEADYNVYCVLGDGEIQEGQVWEAAMTAAHYKLDNLIAFIDHNGLQIDGSNDEVMGVEPIDAKFEAFNWHVIHINGHNIQEISEAIDAAQKVEGKPVMIVADCIKGKGVSYMENEAGWHGKAPSIDERDLALNELRGIN